MLNLTQLTGFGNFRAKSQEGAILWDTSSLTHVPVWTADGGVLIARGTRISAYDANWNHLWTDSIVITPTVMKVIGTSLYVVAANYNGSSYETIVVKFAIGSTGLTITWQKRVQYGSAWSTPFSTPIVADGTYLYFAMHTSEDRQYALVVRLALSDGAYGWSYYYSQLTYPGFSITGLAIAPGGNIIVSGYDQYGDGIESAYYHMWALNSAGTRQWTRFGIGGGTLVVAADSYIYDGICGGSAAVGKFASDGSSSVWAKKLDTSYGPNNLAGIDSSGSLVVASTFAMARVSAAGTIQGYGKWASGLFWAPFPPEILNDRMLLAGRSGTTRMTLCAPAGVPAKCGIYKPSSVSVEFAPYVNTESSATPSIGSTEPPGKGSLALTVDTPTTVVVSDSTPYTGGLFRL